MALDDGAATRTRAAEEALILAVAEEVRRAVEAEGLTRAQLAECLFVSRPRVTHVLSEGRNMTLRTLARLAHATGRRVEVRLVPREQPASAASPETEPLPDWRCQRCGQGIVGNPLMCPRCCYTVYDPVGACGGRERRAS
jgi:predicted XRE-type DNA-binding protein